MTKYREKLPRIPRIALIGVAFIALVSSVSASAAVSTPVSARLENAKLRQEIRQLRIANDKAESTRQAILDWAPFATALLAVFGVVVPLYKELGARRRERAAELEQRKIEERRRFDELFASAIANLGADSEAVKVSGVITLHNFLRSGDDGVNRQVYAVLCANLAVEDHGRLVNRFLIRAFEDAIRLRLPVMLEEDRAVDLVRCRIQRIDLSGLDLRRADLAFADLKDANLRGARLDRARGIEIVLTRAQLSALDDDHPTVLNEVRFNGANAQRAKFHHAKLISAEFRPTDNRHADLQGAEFFHAELQGAHFDGADLRNARFDDANLADAFFKGAIFDNVSLRSLLAAREVDGQPGWMKAHFDPAIRERLGRM